MVALYARSNEDEGDDDFSKGRAPSKENRLLENFEDSIERLLKESEERLKQYLDQCFARPVPVNSSSSLSRAKTKDSFSLLRTPTSSDCSRGLERYAVEEDSEENARKEEEEDSEKPAERRPAKISFDISQPVRRMKGLLPKPTISYSPGTFLASGGAPAQPARFLLTAPTHMRRLIKTGDQRLSRLNRSSSWQPLIDKIQYDNALQEVGIGLVIFVHAALTGITLELTSRMGRAPEWQNWVDLVFVIIYTIDLLVRIYRERIFFLKGYYWMWNLLDTFVVALLLVDQVLQGAWLSTLNILRMVRLSRLFQILRLLRLLMNFKSFRQLRELVSSIMGTLPAFIWSTLVCTSFIYVAAIIFASGAGPICISDIDSDDTTDQLCRYFGSVSMSMLSLYQAMYHGLLWGVLWDALAALSPAYRAFLLVFLSFQLVLVANITNGFFSSLQREVMVKERDHQIQLEMDKKGKFIEQMKHVFQEIDQNGNGAISWIEFKMALEDQRMHAFLATLDIEVPDAMELFRVLDADQTGSIELEEFVLGCLRLRGGAKSFDLVKMRLETDWMVRAMHSLRSSVEEIRTQVMMNKIIESASSIESKGEKSAGNGDLLVPSYTSDAALLFAAHSLPNASPVFLPVEERAVNLQELASIRNTVKIATKRFGWKDQRTGCPLDPQQVNLYHFAYHWILPMTVSPLSSSITLMVHPLLSEDDVTGFLPSEGQEVMQQDSNSKLPAAQGTVVAAEWMEEKQGDSSASRKMLRLRLKLAKGIFRPNVQLTIGNDTIGTLASVEAKGSLSYKERLSVKSRKGTWYCSHWWGEPIMDFVRCCEEHSALRRLPEKQATYWVCAYANRQHELDLDLGSDVLKSSFYASLVEAKGVLLILDPEAVPFRRIWCDYELYVAVLDPSKELDIITLPKATPQMLKPIPDLLSKNPMPGESPVAKSLREANFPISLIIKGLLARLEDGEASVPEDKERILFTMADHVPLNTPEGQERLRRKLHMANNSLKSSLALLAWPQAMSRGVLMNLGRSSSQENQIRLPDYLVADEEMRTLQLSLAHFQETCTDVEVALLATNLPKRLQELRLSFEGCNSITDEGFRILSAKLSPSLKILYLDFVGCNQLTDAGLAALAGWLPGKLEELELHFAGCCGLGTAGLAKLRRSLPRSLTKFTGSFKGTGVKKNYYSLDELHRFKDQGSKSEALGLQWVQSMFRK